MRVILLGPPGSGKGTQGDLVEKKYGFPKISTGDLLRRAVADGTPQGKRAESLMKEGKLVSDDIVEELLRERFSSQDCHDGYLLDGFPRNMAQVRIIERMDGLRPETAIEIVIDLQVLMERLQNRLICSRCEAIFNLSLHRPKKEGVCDNCGGTLIARADDRPEVIRERMRVYQEQTEKLRDYYMAKKAYHRIDGSGSVDEIFHRISDVLEEELLRFKEKKGQG